MKKTKLKERINNAANAFFANDQEKYSENSLSVVNDSGLLKQETIAGFNKKGDVLVKFLKQTFLFLPGAFYLFFGTISALSFELFRESPFSILVMYLIGSFMTIFGIGNIKNPKHLAIPLSIVAVGLTAFSLFSMSGEWKYVFEYGIYFFPIALMAAFLAKSLADKTDREIDSFKDDSL